MKKNFYLFLTRYVAINFTVGSFLPEVSKFERFRELGNKKNLSRDLFYKQMLRDKINLLLEMDEKNSLRKMA